MKYLTITILLILSTIQLSTQNCDVDTCKEEISDCSLFDNWSEAEEECSSKNGWFVKTDLEFSFSCCPTNWITTEELLKRSLDKYLTCVTYFKNNEFAFRSNDNGDFSSNEKCNNFELIN